MNLENEQIALEADTSLSCNYIYSNVFRNSNSAIALVDEKLQIIDCSVALASIFKSNPDLLVGSSFNNLDQQFEIENLKSIIDSLDIISTKYFSRFFDINNDSYSANFRLISEFPVKVIEITLKQDSLLINLSNKLEEAIAINKDLSLNYIHKHNELNTLKNRYNKILDNIPDSFILFDHDLNVISARGSLFNEFASNPNLYENKSVADLLSNEDIISIILPKFKSALSGNDEKFLLPSNMGKHLEVHAYPILDNYGHIDSALAVARDVSSLINQVNVDLPISIDDFLKYSPSAIIIFNDKFEILAWSNSAEQIFGYSADEVINKSIYDLNYVHPDDIPRVIGLFNNLSSETKSIHCTNRNIRKDGKIITCSWNNSVFLDKNKNVKGLISYAIDISNEIEAMEKVNYNLNIMDTLINTIPYPIYYKDIQGRYILTNDLFRTLFIGNSSNSILSVEDLHIDGESIDQIKSKDTEIITNPELIQIFDLDIICKDSITRSFLVLKSIVKDINNNPSGIVGCCIDFTQLKDALSKIETLEQRYKKIFQSSKDAIVFADLKGKIFDFNNSALDLFAIEADALRSKNINEIFHSSSDITNDSIINILRIDNQFASETNIKQPNGAIVNTFMNVSTIDLIGEEYLYYNFRDISINKANERKINLIMDELKKSNDELKEFVYITSHDLQEPLRMIYGFLNLLETKYQEKVDSEASELISYAVSGAVRLQNMIKELLTLTKINSHNNQLKIVDTNKVIETIISERSNLINSNNVKIIFNKLPQIYFDQTHFHILMQNLISNAIKFNNAEPEIQINCTESDSEFLFSVSDNGIGISKDNFQRIFKVFQRLHTSDEFEGSGMGLAICHRIVTKNGGRIWVDSEPGYGSTFFFALPKVIKTKLISNF